MTAKKKVVKQKSLFLGIDPNDWESEFSNEVTDLTGFPIILELIGKYSPKYIKLNID
jgi:hypothetical protein